MSHTAFDLDRARLLARCCDAAYADLDESKRLREQYEQALRMKIHPCESLQLNDDLGIAAFIGTTGNDVVLFFRGTLMEIKSLKHAAIAAANWVINLTFSQIRHGNGKAMIHEGFSYVVETIWDNLRDEIERETGGYKRLWVTGHSLGGAVARL